MQFSLKSKELKAMNVCIDFLSFWLFLFEIIIMSVWLKEPPWAREIVQGK